MESKTPKCDALLLEINEGRVYEIDGPRADLCRTLERENAELGRLLEMVISNNHIMVIGSETCPLCDAIERARALLK